MKYQFKIDDLNSFVSVNNCETKMDGNEMQFKRCPYCGGGSHSDLWTFSVNVEKGVYKCLRSSCDQHGHFVELCRDFDFKLDFGEAVPYRKLKKADGYRVPSDSVFEYFEKRGISADIVRKYEITALKDNPKIIVFPFYDENGELRTAKYRDTEWEKGSGKPKEWFEKNTMPILFGMKQCKGFDRLIITEGQIDALSVAQAGFENVVSVPGGMSNFKWLTISADWINSFSEIIVFGDYENGKTTLIDEIRNRAKTKVKTVKIKDYLGEKDANDILTAYGCQAIEKCIANADLPKINEVKRLAESRQIDIDKMHTIATQIPDIDKEIGGLIMGTVTILAGERGSGKSTLMSQFVAAALDQGETVFAYSGELPDYLFKKWIDLQLAGKRNLTSRVNEFGRTVYDVEKSACDKITRWYYDRAFIYDNAYIPEDEETQNLCDTIERTIRETGCRLICLDNLMTAVEIHVDSDQIYGVQSKFVGQLKKIATRYEVAIVLVAHTRKRSAKNKDENFSNDDIYGSGDVSNKVDVILNYKRHESSEDDPIFYSGTVEISKNRNFGTLRSGNESIKLRYFNDSHRLKQINDTEPKIYGWETIEEQITLPEVIEW